MIFEILREGSDNALTSRAICEHLGITARDLTAAIERERRAGQPICANTGKNPGYYLAASRAEMQKYCESLKGRGIEIFKTRQACLKTIESLPERAEA